MIRHKQLYDYDGTRNSVSAVLLTNYHNHPHLLLLRSKDPDTNYEFQFSLPTARMLPGEGVEHGITRCVLKRVMVDLPPIEWSGKRFVFSLLLFAVCF
jgi:hypothetical protein